MKWLIKFLFLSLLSVTSMLGAPANTPTITVSPVYQEAVVGTQYAYLHVYIDECPTSKDIVVTATDSNTSSFYDDATFLSPSCIQVKVLSIDISDVALGDSRYVNLVATSSQSVNPIITTPVEIRIVPPPTNTPIVSISPVTKNILDTTTTVAMNVLISECPNKEDINATISYKDENNLTVSQNFIFTVDTCNLSEPFTVNIPTWLGLNESMDVNLTAVTSGEQIIGAISPNVATITVLDTVSDMTIDKTAPGIVEINDIYQYTLKVTNLSGSSAFNVQVRDTLPFGVELNATTAAGWACSESEGVVNCSYLGSIASGVSSTIVLDVTAPGYSTTVTNSATVVSGNDSDILNNTDSAITQIVDLGKATDLCYTNSTFVESAPSTCSDRTGVSYYKLSTAPANKDCTAFMTIRNANPDTPLTSVKVQKLYNPNIDSGTCLSTTDYTCESKSDSTLVSGYSGAYEYEFSTDLGVDENVTIEDTNTEYNGEITDIVLYGEYQKDGYTYKGQVSACTGGANGIDFASTDKADIVDTFTSMSEYNFDVINNVELNNHITTKIAGDTPVTITGVHLDRDTSLAVPYAPAGGTAAWTYSIIPYLSDGSCSTEGENLIDPSTGLQAVIDVPYQNVAATTQITVPSTASKENRIKIIVVDLATLSVEGQSCILNSSTTGNFARIAQCANSAVQYIDAFGDDAWERCGVSSGAPCLSDNHGVADVNDPSYDPVTDSIYVNDLGCYMCTFDLVSNCSSDDFAIRPDRFDVSPTLTAPVKAKEPTALTFTALDLNATPAPTAGYNETQDTSFTVDLNISDPTASCTYSSFSLSPNVNFVEGIVSGDYLFDHVGVVDMNVSEIAGAEFALVDQDDTIDSQRFITPWSQVVTIIPDHFDLNVTYYDANRDHNFTYLSDGQDGFNMMSLVDITLVAKDYVNDTTENYDGNCSAQNVDLTLTHSTVPAPLTEIIMRLQPKYVTEPPVDKNISIADPITFTSVGSNQLPKEYFMDGVADIELLINFDRKTDKPLNPFKFTVNDMTVADENGTTTVTSPQTLDQNATFFYARVHSPRNRAMCNGVTCYGNVNFYYEVYAKTPTATEKGLITTLLGNSPKKSLDSVNWYRNTVHNLNSDGNVTASHQNIPIYTGTPVSFSQNNTMAVSTGTYNYDGSNGYPFKGTVTVNSSLNETQQWLIFDPYKDGAIEGTAELEYYGPGSWSSDTGADESVNDASGKKNRNTNRRIRW